MSSILKALRKIEEEKRVASHSAPDLRMDQGHSARKGWPFLPLVAGIVLGAVCVGLFSFWPSSETTTVVTLPMRQPSVAGVESRQADQPPVMVEGKKVFVPVESPDVPVKEPIAAPVTEVIKVREVIMPAEAVAVISEQSETQKQQTGIVSEPKPSPEVVAPEIMATTATRAPAVDLSASKAPTVDLPASKAPTVDPGVVKPKTLPEGAHLKVSEIFYHDDPANSMAVVNDLPVMIGTFVDSAKVLEIHSDKVVFQIDDSTYDVPVTPLP